MSIEIIKSNQWFDELMNTADLETLEMFENRINTYIWNSIPEQGELWTSKGLEGKVYSEWETQSGKLKPFYGNTIVYTLDEKAISYVKEIQNRLINECQGFLAEPLDSNTFHITLHDLVNSQNQNEIMQRMKHTGFVALSILQQLKRMNITKIRMESTCVFNMASTSVVLGMKPTDEVSMKVLMLLHQLFQSVVYLDYPLTPHVTLAYFRPGIHSAEMLAPLRKIIDDINRSEKLVVELDITQLEYQEFCSMNHYITKVLK